MFSNLEFSSTIWDSVIHPHNAHNVSFYGLALAPFLMSREEIVVASRGALPKWCDRSSDGKTVACNGIIALSTTLGASDEKPVSATQTRQIYTA